MALFVGFLCRLPSVNIDNLKNTWSMCLEVLRAHQGGSRTAFRCFKLLELVERRFWPDRSGKQRIFACRDCSPMLILQSMGNCWIRVFFQLLSQRDSIYTIRTKSPVGLRTSQTGRDLITTSPLCQIYQVAMSSAFLVTSQTISGLTTNSIWRG